MSDELDEHGAEEPDRKGRRRSQRHDEHSHEEAEHGEPEGAAQEAAQELTNLPGTVLDQHESRQHARRDREPRVNSVRSASFAIFADRAARVGWQLGDRP